MPKIRTLAPPIRTLDTRSVKTAPKKAEPFYLSLPWRQLMADIIRDRGRRCEDCGRADTRIFGDHIVELKDGGAPLDPLNVKCLCGSCHSRKTAATRARRMASRP